MHFCIRKLTPIVTAVIILHYKWADNFFRARDQLMDLVWKFVEKMLKKRFLIKKIVFIGFIAVENNCFQQLI